MRRVARDRGASGFTLLLAGAIATIGCAGSIPTVHWSFFAWTSGAPPDLRGRTVAVLPPLAGGPEMIDVELATRASERIFRGELADVIFRSPDEVVERLRADVTSFDAIRISVTQGLPSDLGPAGESRRIHEGAWRPEDEEAASKLVIDLQEKVRTSIELAPASLDPELFTALDCDYVLVAAPMSYYFQQREITAIYGLIPLAGSVRVRNVTPRGLFALYEARSGERVWEGYVGVASARGTSGVALRALPMIGATYLLIGDLEAPLLRLQSRL